MSEFEHVEIEVLKARVAKLERERAEFYNIVKRALLMIVHFTEHKLGLKIESL